MRREGLLIVLAVVCLLVAVGAMGYGAGAASSVPEVVRAQHFELVDGAGRVRAELGLWPDGSSGLVLYDETGNITGVLPSPSQVSSQAARGAARGIAHEGVGDDVIGIPSPQPGTGTLYVRGNASSDYFGIRGRDARGELTGVLVSTTEPYEGRVRIPAGTTRLEVSATGRWSLTFE